MLIFGYVTFEVYIIDWPNGQWVRPTQMGHTPTLKMGILQYKIGQPVWLLSITVYCFSLALTHTINPHLTKNTCKSYRDAKEGHLMQPRFRGQRFLNRNADLLIYLPTNIDVYYAQLEKQEL